MISKDFVAYTETELTSIIMRFVGAIEESKAKQIAKEIIDLIDWNNSALMHKGLSWMAKDYLVKRNMM